MNHPSKTWFSALEAAQYLKIKLNTLYNLKCKGKIKGYNSGGSQKGKLLFLKTDLDNFITGKKMSITKNKKNLFDVRVTKTINGKSIEKRKRDLNTKGEARKVAQELITELVNLSKRKKQMLWEDALKEYLCNYKKKVSASTFYTAEYSLKKYTESWLNRPISSFYPEEIEAHINEVHKFSADATKASLLKYIRGVFLYYFKRGVIKSNPTSGLNFKKPPQKKLSAMTRSEIIELLKFTKAHEHPWHPIFRVTYELGLRSGEALALEWEDVDFENKQICISKSYCSKSKAIKSTKNEEVRTVVLNDSLLTFLKELYLKKGARKHILPQINKWKRGEAAQVLYRSGLIFPET